MTTVKRVLIIAYYFPPIGGIGSIRLSRFAEELPRFGWEATVVAPGRTPHAVDADLTYAAASVLRARSLEPSLIGRSRSSLSASATPAASPESVVRRARSLARSLLAYPDAQIGWYSGAVRTALAATRSNRFDAVFSSSNPITAHLVAGSVSRRARLPWLAEFRDPWADGVAVHHRRLARLHERRLVRRPDAVAMPTPTWAQHYGHRWGRDVVVLPNGHDGIPRGTVPDSPVLTHLGTFYSGLQDLSPLWAALRDGLGDGRLADLRVRFIGSMPADARRGAAEAGVDGRLEATGFVPHSEAVQLLANSSMLLACGFPADSPKTAGWVPAKLFEYLASDRPILFIGEAGTDAARMLEDQPGCFRVAPDDVDGVVRALHAGLEVQRVTREVDNLSRRTRAAQLAQILDEISERRS